MMPPDEVVAIRQRLGLSQVELAEKLGVNERTIRRWETVGCVELVAMLLTKLSEEQGE